MGTSTGFHENILRSNKLLEKMPWTWTQEKNLLLKFRSCFGGMFLTKPPHPVQPDLLSHTSEGSRGNANSLHPAELPLFTPFRNPMYLPLVLHPCILFLAADDTPWHIHLMPTYINGAKPQNFLYWGHVMNTTCPVRRQCTPLSTLPFYWCTREVPRG